MSCICWTDNPFDGIDISECVKYAVERYGKARMEIFENEQKIAFEFTGGEVIN